MSNNLGNVTALLKSVDPPAKKYVLWGKILNVDAPDIVDLRYWNNVFNQWLSLTDSKYYWNPVEAISNVPAVSPALNESYIIASSPTGAWVGKAGQVATWNGGAWEYSIPTSGVTTMVKAEKRLYTYNTTWKQSSKTAGMFPPVSNLTALQSLVTTDAEDWPTGYLILVEDTGIYRYDRTSSATANGSTVITSTVGRFLRETARPEAIAADIQTALNTAMAAIGGKVSKTGDTMTGQLNVNISTGLINIGQGNSITVKNTTSVDLSAMVPGAVYSGYSNGKIVGFTNYDNLAQIFHTSINGSGFSSYLRFHESPTQANFINLPNKSGIVAMVDDITAATITAINTSSTNMTAAIAAYDLALKAGVPTEGNNLNKLYNLILGGFKEQTVPTLSARNSYNVTSLPQNVFVEDDGDGRWALYKATSTGVGANFVKISDPDLLNSQLPKEVVKSLYESNADTNAFTDALKAKLASLALMDSYGQVFDGTPIVWDTAVKGDTVYVTMLGAGFRDLQILNAVPGRIYTIYAYPQTVGAKINWQSNAYDLFYYPSDQVVTSNRDGRTAMTFRCIGVNQFQYICGGLQIPYMGNVGNAGTGTLAWDNPFPFKLRTANLTGALTVNPPANPDHGEEYTILFIGAGTVTWNSSFKFPSGYNSTQIIQGTGAGGYTVFSFRYNNVNPGFYLTYSNNAQHFSKKVTSTILKFDTDTQVGSVDAPVTGNVTFDFNGAQPGAKARLIHNQATELEFASPAVVIRGDYVPGQNNRIIYEYWDNSTVLVEIDPIAEIGGADFNAVDLERWRSRFTNPAGPYYATGDDGFNSLSPGDKDRIERSAKLLLGTTFTGLTSANPGVLTVPTAFGTDLRSGNVIKIVSANGNQTSGGTSIVGKLFTITKLSNTSISLGTTIAGSTPATSGTIILWDIYNGPTKKSDGVTDIDTTYIPTLALPEPLNEGDNILCCAFTGRVLRDQGYINSAKTQILAQIAVAQVNFANATLWEHGRIKDTNPGFLIAQWVARVFRAYSFIRPYFSAAEKTSIETWFYNAGKWMADEVNQAFNAYFISGAETITSPLISANRLTYTFNASALGSALGYRGLYRMQSTMSLTSISSTNPGIVTVASTAALNNGDLIYLSSVNNGQQANGSSVNGQHFTITVINGTTFSIGAAVTGATAATSGTVNYNVLKTHDGGHNITNGAVLWNNRWFDLLVACAYIGYHFKSIGQGPTKGQYMIDTANQYFKEWLVFGMYPPGASQDTFGGLTSELERYRDSSGNDYEHAVHYLGIVMFQAATIAYLAAKNGDSSIKNFSTEKGLANTVGTLGTAMKSLELGMARYLKFFDTTGTITVLGGKVLDGIDLLQSPAYYIHHDIAVGVMAYSLYGDPSYQAAYRRQRAGNLPYQNNIATNANNPGSWGNNNEWTAAGGVWPGILLMEAK